MRHVWSVCTAACWLLCVSVLRGEPLYDQPPPHNHLMFRGENYVENKPVYDGDPASDDFLINSYLKSLQDGEDSRTDYRVNWNGLGWQNLFTQQLPEELRIKTSPDKRLGDSTGISKHVGNVARPQQKWKTKKGSLMVCYFKLCSFRPSYYYGN